MADRQVSVKYIITDNGTSRVLDEMGRKTKAFADTTEETGRRAASAFEQARAGAIATAAAVAGVGVAAVKVAGQVNQSIQEIDKIGELANAIGLTAEELSSLRLPAAQGGASLEAVGRAVQFFNRELVKAREGGGKAALFESLGITNLERDAIPVLLDVADALGDIRSGAERSAAGQAIFGRQYLAVANVITPALREQIALNKQLGGTLSNEVVAAAGQAADQLDALKFAAGTLADEVTAALLPEITAATTTTLEWAAANREVVSSGLVGYLHDARDAIAGLQAIGDLPVLRELRELNLYLAGGAIESVAALGRRDWETGTGRIPPGEITERVREVAARVGGTGTDEGARRVRAALGGTTRPAAASAARETAQATQEARREARELLDVWADIDIEVQETAGRVYDLTSAVGDVPARVLEGLLGRDGGFNLGDLVAGSGQAIATEFASGLLAAQLEKDKFDLAVSENFSVTLPGFMREGTDAIVGIFGGAMETITGDASQAATDIAGSFGRSYAQVGSGASNTASVLAGLARAGYTTGDFQVSGTAGNYLVQDQFGTRFSGPELGATLETAGGVGGGGTAAGSGAALGAAAGAAGGLLVAIQATLAALDAIEQLKGTIELGNIITEGQIRETGARAAFGTVGLGGIGDIYDDIPQGARVAINTIFNPLANIFELPGVLQPPTQGSQTKEGLSKAIDRANLPEQSVFDVGESGVRSKFLEVIPDEQTAARFAAAGFGTNIPGLKQPTLSDFPRGPIQETIQTAAAANPEVDAFRTNEALAYGVLSTGKLRGGTLVANALTSNLLLQGVSEKEARRQTRKLAEQSGVGLDTGVEEAQRLYTEGVFKDDPLTDVNEKTQQLVTTITGLVGIFEEDIPAGVDVAALAMANFTEGVGVDVAEFNEDLRESLLLFGELRATSREGLRGGIGGSLDKFAGSRTAYNAQGPVNEIIRLRLEGQAELVSEIQDALYEGATTGLEQALYDQLVKSDAWKAVEQQIAEVIATGDLTDLPESIRDAVAEFLPAITATSEAAAALKEALGTTPAELLAAGASLQERLDAAKFGDLSPQQQEAQVRGELGDQRAQIDEILAGGVTAEERAPLAKLLQEYGDTGLQLADLGDGYAPGSLKSKQAKQQGYDATQFAADMFEQFGLSLGTGGVSGEPLVAALQDNTEATKAQTAAMTGRQPGSGAMTVNIGGDGGQGADWSHASGMLKDLAAALKQPALRPVIRDIARAR